MTGAAPALYDRLEELHGVRLDVNWWPPPADGGPLAAGADPGEPPLALARFTQLRALTLNQWSGSFWSVLARGYLVHLPPGLTSLGLVR